jgi:NAD+-dependent protein deacetylase sirtuin 5
MYASIARSMGAKVAVVNMDRSDAPDLQRGDWFFQGDAAQIVPEMLKSIIGEVVLPHEDIA